MARIHCRPDDVRLAAAEGTLLGALVGAGVPIAHACGGNARCSTCRVRVEDGAAACAPRTAEERAMADRLRFDDDTRLACQTRLVAGAGDLTVRRLVIDALDLGLAAATARTTGRVGCELDLAVLFADIAGFTTLSEDLPAYDVVHLLDRWFAVAGPAVEGHGGRIDNYMGDGLMAVFGATPAPDAPDPAQSGVRAALALVAAAREVDRYTREVYGRGFAVRVGVHFGKAVVGTLGAAHNRRETAIGDVVNVAARLEAANKEVGSAVLVSDVVAARLGPAFRLGRTAEIALKGKSGVHRVIEVVGAA